MRRALLAALVMSTALLSVAAGSSPLAMGKNLSLINKFAPSGIRANYLGRLGQVHGQVYAPESIPPPVTAGSNGCPDDSTSNIRVNQDCTNQAGAPPATRPASPLYGRASSQNETAVAVNPLKPRNILASVNDYQGGDSTCGAAFSLDGGRHWGSRILPMHFSTPGFGGAPRHYWDASGDTSVAFDSSGEAYLMCMAFDRGPGVSDNGDFASGLFLFRSADGGASWSFVGSPVVVADGTDPTLNLIDKPYMTIDNNPTSPGKDRIYVSWSFFNAAQTASPIYFAYSLDFGNSWFQPSTQPVSGGSATLCPINFDGSPPGTCNANQFSNPFVAPNGDVYVAFQNFNNCNGAFGRPCSGPATDNHNQMLIVKSTTGGTSFGAPVKVTDYYELPDCVTYTSFDSGRACVPTAPASGTSIFRAVNYPTGIAVSSTDIVVDFGSYINVHSNPSNPPFKGDCFPAGINPSTGQNLYTGVGVTNRCNNDIVRSESTNGGLTFTGTSTPVTKLPVVSAEAPGAPKKRPFTDQWWQWSALTPGGLCAVSYYDRRYASDQVNGKMDITLATGTGFVKVTIPNLPPSNEFPASNGYSLFMGDYNALAIALEGDQGIAHPVWTDTRNPIFTYDPTPAIDPRPLVSAGYGADAYTRRVVVK